MRIFLIGYMGCGKSTFGKKLSQKLHLQFIDLDRYIEEQHHLTIAELFEKKGEVAFREMEHDAIKKLFTQTHIVISTGGGTPCFYNNIDLMNKNGTTIYLQASIDLLLSRLKQSKKERPLIKNRNEEELRDFIQHSLTEREVFYLKAQYVIDAKNASAEQLATILQAK